MDDFCIVTKTEYQGFKTIKIMTMYSMHPRRKKLWGLCLQALLLGVPLTAFSQTKEVTVVGTVVGQVPDLPAKVKIGNSTVPVTWEQADAGLFRVPFSNVQVKGTATLDGGKKSEVSASVWALPDNLVYLIDAGRLLPEKSQIFEAAKSLRGNLLLNEAADKKCASSTDKWGYVERSTQNGQNVYVTKGNEKDWATSFISDGQDKDEGLTYKLTLSPGEYKITVAYVPCLNLSIAGRIRVDGKLVSTGSLKTTVSDDKIHPAIYASHVVRLTKTSSLTYETDKLGGEQWENVCFSLIAVEKISSNIDAPFLSSAGGDFWEPQTVSLNHKDPNAEIYYTLDGSKPDKNSRKYEAPIEIKHTTRLNTVAYVKDEASKVVSADFAINTWAATATAFKLVGSNKVCNVKVNWMQRADADTYKIYRDGQIIGTVSGDTYDDYDLSEGTYTYYVEGYKDGQKIARSEAQQTTTFVLSGKPETYDNFDGKYLVKDNNAREGIKIGNLYFSYKMENVEKDQSGKKVKGWLLTESWSGTGLKGSWSKPRELAFYPGVKFEGIGFRFNKKTGKVVLSAHYEDKDGYTAAKVYLAQITPKGGVEVGTMERPLGYDSRDQSVFVDDDGTAYLLSATRTNSDINIYRLDETWTKPVSLVNTIFINQHRETPAIIKRDGEYYFFSSKASGWYPSQAMYSSATDLGGIWTTLREIGNNSTFGAQANNIRTYGTERQTFGMWSYHWGAQYDHKDPNGNFPRLSVVSFNKGYASMDYYSYLEFDSKHGIIPVQNGRRLTQNASTTAILSSGKEETGIAYVTDGADMNSSACFKGGNCPFSLIVDLKQEAQISEINLSTKMVNGSETAYKYTIEGSRDGKEYTMLVDGKDNWLAGFQILRIDDKAPYRYLRLNVSGVVNVHNGNSAMWAEGIYELNVFGASVNNQ